MCWSWSNIIVYSPKPLNQHCVTTIYHCILVGALAPVWCYQAVIATRQLTKLGNYTRPEFSSKKFSLKKCSLEKKFGDYSSSRKKLIQKKKLKFTSKKKMSAGWPGISQRVQNVNFCSFCSFCSLKRAKNFAALRGPKIFKALRKPKTFKTEGKTE